MLGFAESRVFSIAVKAADAIRHTGRDQRLVIVSQPDFHTTPFGGIGTRKRLRSWDRMLIRSVGLRLHHVLLWLLLASGPVGVAQVSPPKNQKVKAPIIQDNSFLVEEAYNQESGVIQHISSFSRSWTSSDWVYSFTEEVPLFGQKNQFSVTLSFAGSDSGAGSSKGIGDVALNYRYQLLGSGESRVAVSPRFSVLLPTGSSKRALGAGAIGLQVNLPVSLVLSEKIVAHSNAGFTYIPRAKDLRDERANIKGVNLGQSLIWLAHPRFNVMLETVWNRVGSVVGPGQTQPTESFLVNPGFRWAHNFESGLQIVPGISFPIGVGPSRGDRRVLFYLSFEHPFRRR